jgi:pimeloyl-ACP methyl ester carboxylesterase
MKRVLDALDKEPLKIEIRNSKTGQPQTLLVGKHALQFITALGLGRTREIANLPALYYSISQGDTSLLARAVQQLQFRINAPVPWAMTFAMDCASGASPQRRARIKREEKLSLLGDAANFTDSICSLWGQANLGKSFHAPVKSSLPVLFISGTLDSNTPVAQAREIAKGFPNSRQVIIEGAGHEDLLSSTQIGDTIANFLGGLPQKPEAISLPPIKFTPLRQ